MSLNDGNLNTLGGNTHLYHAKGGATKKKRAGKRKGLRRKTAGKKKRSTGKKTAKKTKCLICKKPKCKGLFCFFN